MIDSRLFVEEVGGWGRVPHPRSPHHRPLITKKEGMGQVKKVVISSSSPAEPLTSHCHRRVAATPPALPQPPAR